MNILKKLFGTSSAKELKSIYPIVDKIEALDAEYSKLTDEQLKAKTPEFKKRLSEGETLDDILPEAFATCREAAWRVLGMKPYRVQLIGGVILHQGRIAEMRTGEGKTLVATLPAYLNALAGEGVHIVTVNDYLAKRDSEWMGKVYRFLGLTVGLVIHDILPQMRKASYQADITYGTNNEFGFDYLRDNMAIYASEMVQRGHAFAIVDEVDSILIDEARTPLIISGQGDQSTQLYTIVDSFVSKLKGKRVAKVDTKEEEDRTRMPTTSSMRRPVPSPSPPVASGRLRRPLMWRTWPSGEHHSLPSHQPGHPGPGPHAAGYRLCGEGRRGHHRRRVHRTSHVRPPLLRRPASGHRGQGACGGRPGVQDAGYHHLPELLPPLQQALRHDGHRHDRGGGIRHHLRPGHRGDPHQRSRGPDRSPRRGLQERGGQVPGGGQPDRRVPQEGSARLVGTISIEKSEELSALLKKRGIPHKVLNAKFHEKEAEIVAQAGKLGAVTVATNMAGRGTDIMLGGNAEYLAKADLRKAGLTDELVAEATGYAETDNEDILNARRMYAEAEAKYKENIRAEAEKVREVGGLFILGTERHESRRIDNQLRGRAGRQGDPGESRFYLSLEDDVMRLFGSERVMGMMEKLGVDEDTPIDAKMLSGAIENAQRQVESRNFQTRKTVLEYDDVMNTQRKVIYEERRKVLDGENLRSPSRRCSPMWSPARFTAIWATRST